MICLPWGISGVTSMRPASRVNAAYWRRTAPSAGALSAFSSVSPRILECRRPDRPAAAMKIVD
jgi:hypothetical protein